MPTDKKRVNLTIPEEVYTRLLAYRTKNGISTDAGACMQLIVRQLDSIENSEKILALMSRYSLDELKQLSDEGFTTMQALIATRNGSNNQ